MAKVLFCVVFSILIISVHCGMTPEMDAQIQKMKKMVRQVCQSNFKVSDAVVEEALSTRKVPTDQNFKCFLHCTLEISRLMSDDELNFDMVRKQAEAFLPPDMKGPLIGALDICSKKVQKGKDKCDTAYNVVVCFGENGPDGLI